ncbi:hypothetical protein EVAR_81137_1 [Eumeta japonica]|uniref:Uncharacterized protein n=1 Tax=Eumeta variegata TaxID=151549 RepID=A0A4C1ULD0_EUMVA|nr:hypothetical protein EVAR_81137_1 [Eumeta japonica]
MLVELRRFIRAVRFPTRTGSGITVDGFLSVAVFTTRSGESLQRAARDLRRNLARLNQLICDGNVSSVDSRSTRALLRLVRTSRPSVSACGLMELRAGLTPAALSVTAHYAILSSVARDYGGSRILFFFTPARVDVRYLNTQTAVWKCPVFHAEAASSRNISSNIFACTAYCRGLITDERPKTNIRGK